MKIRYGSMPVLTMFTLIITLVTGSACFSAPAKYSLKSFNKELIAITKKALPSVVNLSGIRMIQPGGGGFNNHPFPKLPPGMQNKVQSLGSGVIIDKKGYIITNNHVIKNTSFIKITLSDKREFKCKIIGTDPATDIAVIMIEGKVPANLPVIAMSDSDQLEVGELVIAIGNPFGFSHTVTMGIVSAKGRENVGLVNYENYIQTDAAINPGNSGGALINMEGKLVGINTAIYSRSGGSMGIGFAIPTNMIGFVVKELMKTGKVIRGWLGIYIQNVTKDISESLAYGKENGALVSDIIQGSPAVSSGIKVGDIITSIDDIVINDVNQLRRLIALKKPGTVCKLTVFRNGKTVPLSLTVGTLPDAQIATDKTPQGPADPLGLVVNDIDEKLAYRYKIMDTTGVVITRVFPNTIGAMAGLLEGDLIKEIDKKPVHRLSAYQEALRQIKGKSKVLFLLKRGNMNTYVVVTLSPEK